MIIALPFLHIFDSSSDLCVKICVRFSEPSVACEKHDGEEFWLCSGGKEWKPFHSRKHRLSMKQVGLFGRDCGS